MSEGESVLNKEFIVPEGKLHIEKEILMTIIRSIPDNWQVLMGQLVAPQSMISTGEALASTRLLFASSISQMIDRVDNEHKADIFSVMFGGKHPCKVQFGHLFKGVEVMPMDQSKLVVLHFVSLGYRGRLDFGRREVEYIGDRPDFACSLWFLPDDKKGLVVQIQAHREETPESEATIAPILSKCQELLVESTQVVAG